MRKMINLCNADLNEEMFRNLLFFAWAGPGAMGEPGGLTFITNTGEVYHCNYEYGDIDIKKVVKLFPVWTKYKADMVNDGSMVSEGWKHVYLGMHNHLLVNDEVYDEFRRLRRDKEEVGEIFASWRMIAEKILNNRNTVTDVNEIEKNTNI